MLSTRIQNGLRIWWFFCNSSLQRVTAPPSKPFREAFSVFCSQVVVIARFLQEEVYVHSCFLDDRHEEFLGSRAEPSLPAGSLTAGDGCRAFLKARLLLDWKDKYFMFVCLFLWCGRRNRKEVLQLLFCL